MKNFRSKKCWIVPCAIILIIVIALGLAKLDVFGDKDGKTPSSPSSIDRDPGKTSSSDVK